MKCPECVKTHQTSRCFRNNHIVASMPDGSEYWDEEGIFHRHDPHWTIKSFHCDRGHCWTVRWRRPCPACKFGHIEPETRIVNPA